MKDHSAWFVALFVGSLALGLGFGTCDRITEEDPSIRCRDSVERVDTIDRTTCPHENHSGQFVNARFNMWLVCKCQPNATAASSVGLPPADASVLGFSEAE